MVEQGRLPFHAVVTPGARRDSTFRKLQAMDIRVAGLTGRRGCPEIRVHEPDSWGRRFMATETFRNRMSAAQGEARPGMVEAGEFFP